MNPGEQTPDPFESSTRAARNTFLAVLLVPVLIGAWLAWSWVAGPWTPAPLDLGPFHGRACDIPAGQPRTALDVGSRFRIESYERRDSDRAPVVALRGRGGTVLWSVCAEPDGPEEVVWIELKDSVVLPFIGIGVEGSTYWDGGGLERTVWRLGTDGHLEEFWYSW